VLEVRIAHGHVWVLRDQIDLERDDRIIGALLDVLDSSVEFHTTTMDRAGMVPDGQRVV
jgi:hypothetical protein